jgi:hypothetical protein
LTAVLLASCGDGAATATVAEQATAPTATAAPGSTTTLTETTETPLPSTEECEEPATEIAFGSSISEEIVGSDEPGGGQQYFCVQVPDGVSSITFELKEMTSDLNLYVGHPDLETVQQGGLWFWASDDPGTDDEVVVVEPALTDYVNSGSYYIEVSGEDFRESSSFTLTVRTP